MSLSTPDCWKLLIQSGLLSREQCQHLSMEYGRAHGDRPQRDARQLVRWLISQRLISRYQASVLLSGREGPFHYGDYRVHDRISKGRLKGAFRAWHTPTHHPVLLQFVTAAKVEDRLNWSRLSAVLPRLAHPHLIRYFATVDLGGDRFFVLEDLRGTTLETWLKTKGRLEISEACRVAAAIAKALAYLWQQGMPHGDVRPHHVWLERTGNVKLIIDSRIDSGPVELSDQPAELKVDYLAPELARGEAPSELSDMYALGCLLYQLVAGAPPFAGGSVAEKPQRHAGERAPLLPPPLGTLVAAMLAKQPADRVHQPEAVVERLAALIDPHPAAIQPAPPLPTLAAYEGWLRGHQVDEKIEPDRPGPPPPQHAAVDVRDGPLAASNAVINRGIPSGRRRSATGAGLPLANRLRQSRARVQRRTLQGGVGLVAVLAMCALLVYALNRSRHREAPPVAVPPRAVPPVGLATSAEVRAAFDAPAEAGVVTAPLLWARPTHGDPIQLQFLPGGAQMFLIARLADIVSDAEGQRVLQALGPDFGTIYDRWLAAAGVVAQDVQRLVVGVYGNHGEFPRLSCVVHLSQPQTTREMRARWGQPELRRSAGDAYFVGSEWAYWIPPAAGGRTFVMGHEIEVQDLVASQQSLPLLRREMAQLLRVSDDQQHVTLLLAPNFLFSDGRPILDGGRAMLRGPLEALLGDKLKAALASMHFGEEVLYLELRLHGDATVDRFTLASRFHDRLARLPDEVEAYLAALRPAPYWRQVATRYPAMLQFLCRQTRSGAEGDQAVLNAALPASAAHNLLFGGELMLATSAQRASTPILPVEPAPQTLEQALAAQVSLSCEQESLEFLVNSIETEFRRQHRNLPFPFKIRLVGDDLRQEGITRNQQIRNFRQVDRTLAQVLTALVMAANPVGSASASAADQQLVWGIGPNPDDGTEQVILITTRGAAGEKIELPAVFGGQFE